ncbi:MAG: ATP-binding protein [Desulfobacteraceae bacterium]|jgi:signal transduction histidine kinase|nr:ATP-binding protein [Desulfobacteraceae bacterium]
MVKSLYSKLAIALLGLFCLLGVSIVILTQVASDMYQQEVVQKLNRDLARQIAAQKNLMQDHQINQKGLTEIFDMLMVVNPSIEVYLLSPGGDILAYSAPPGKVKRDRVDLRPIKKWFEAGTVFPLTGDDPRNPDKKKVFSAARIPEQGALQGYLYIILGGELFDSIAQKLKGSYIMQLSAWWLAASLLFVLAAGLLLFAYLTRRLRRLAVVMASVDLEQTAVQLESMSAMDRLPGDEIDRLTVTFKQLVDRIQTQVEKLKKADSMRRELVTNVSHDLRTPLATLKGYIETLFLKDKRLSASDRKHHLEIAIQHCERLSQLVDELFELAKLDSNEIQVRYEPFNISELAHDVMQKFDLSAKEKQLSMQIDLDPDLPFVNADIAMIERVIENLLENAVRHTPPGGSIRLTLSPQNADIAVGVSDTGCGISGEDLPFIFDRFYQREKTRTGQKGYSGLGLAIARRVLELHNKPIQVESTPGSGTTFTFLLPAHHPV